MPRIKYIEDILPSTKVTNYKLESLIGKLNYNSHIITLERYFLTSLYQLLNRSNKWLTQRALACYREELKFLTKNFRWLLKWEVPINNIIIDKPTVTLWFTNGNIMGCLDLAIPAHSLSTERVVFVIINLISGHRQGYSVNLSQEIINRWVRQWHHYTNHLQSNVHLES